MLAILKDLQVGEAVQTVGPRGIGRCFYEGGYPFLLSCQRGPLKIQLSTAQSKGALAPTSYAYGAPRRVLWLYGGHPSSLAIGLTLSRMFCFKW